MEILIVDDDKNICEYIEQAINNHMNIGNDCYVKTFDNVPFLLSYIEDGGRPDVIFMDIRLNMHNGIEIASKLQQHDNNITIVFVTGYIEYAEDIFEAKPFDFLVKPITQEKLDKVLKKLITNQNSKEHTCIKVLENGAIYYINKKDIIYVEAALKYSIIYTDKKTYKTKTMFKILEKELEDNLIKTHRSFMLNPSRIKKIEGLEIEMINGDIVPISRSKKKEIYDKL